MRFRNTYAIEDANAIQALSFDVEIRLAHRSIRVQASNDRDDFSKILLTASAEIDVKEKNSLVIQQAVTAPVAFFESAEPGQPRDGLSLPRHYEDLVGSLSRDFHSASVKAWKILLWRFNVTSGSRFITGRGFEVQIEDSWRPLPTKGSARGSIRATLPGPNRDLSILGPLANSLNESPLAFDLLHEARELCSRNPRAALSIGIVALEVGFKNMVSELMPVNKWLVENSPSPPLERMIREWMVSLPVRLTIDGEVKIPSERIMANLKKGIRLRNSLVHTGQANIGVFYVDDLLDDISDCLRIFDYYLGYSWAARYLEDETLDELDFPEWRAVLDEHIRPALRRRSENR